MGGVYYNDNDRYCCDVLRARIADGNLPRGFVDERDISEVSAEGIKKYAQAHFFAGIGGWPYAVELSDWPADEPIWTASCPCQPISGAGKRRGEKDSRHLWPALYRLISKHKPNALFGEQVASGDGSEWLDGVSLDLEEIGYRVGTIDLPAAGEGAPIIRQRLWWVACPNGGHASTEREQCGGQQRQQQANGGDSEIGARMASAMPTRRATRRTESGNGQIAGSRSNSERLASTASTGRRQSGSARGEIFKSRTVKRLAGLCRSDWSNYEIVWCDERAAGKGWVPRRTQSGVFPLAPRLSGRMDQLRAIGNSIVPQVAARFINAFLEVKNGGTLSI
ncbi:hypothetical protein LCGC14_1126560 [marine sediment metagenome]|uniref:DNA (cytosine-5-)-methyltransferase n=1 Tax=marine sediment metagenome TaxID=412755 RepID=A0A0F9Q874_9ZZZZ